MLPSCKSWSRIILLVVGAISLAAGNAAQAQDALDVATLKRIKAATVYMDVALADGSILQGSGFFVDEPGLVLTNAHVLGMLDPDSRRPVKITVHVNPGEPSRRNLSAKFLGVDRGTDLAVLRVEAKDLPQPLVAVSAAGLIETQRVYIFGFPFGKQLGKNITVSESSVSSLTKAGTTVQKVQVNGGMHPGNSGGPVTDAKGQVVGVAVAGIPGTQINFAVPGNRVTTFLNGRVTTVNYQLAYKDGAGYKMPVGIMVVDPLGRLKKISVESFTGLPGKPRLGSITEPKPLPDDSPVQSFDVPYDKSDEIRFELPLPAIKDPKMVRWMRPVFVDGADKTRWFGASSPKLSGPVERKEVTLAYRPKEGMQPAQLLSEGTFKLFVKNEEKSLTMNMKATVEETSTAKEGQKYPLRLTYKGFGLDFLVDKESKASPELKKLVGDIRFLATDIEMDGEGNLLRSRLDLSKVPPKSRAAVKEISEQLLQTLEILAIPLPEGTIKATQNWKAQRNLFIGNAVLGVPVQADIKYTYLGVRPLKGRDIAFINLKGTIRGQRGDGLEVGGKLSGGAQVDLVTGEVRSGTVTINADMDLSLDKQKVKAIGLLKVRIGRGDVTLDK